MLCSCYLMCVFTLGRWCSEGEGSIPTRATGICAHSGQLSADEGPNGLKYNNIHKSLEWMQMHSTWK